MYLGSWFGEWTDASKKGCSYNARGHNWWFHKFTEACKQLACVLLLCWHVVSLWCLNIVIRKKANFLNTRRDNVKRYKINNSTKIIIARITKENQLMTTWVWTFQMLGINDILKEEYLKKGILWNDDAKFVLYPRFINDFKV